MSGLQVSEQPRRVDVVVDEDMHTVTVYLRCSGAVSVAEEAPDRPWDREGLVREMLYRCEAFLASHQAEYMRYVVANSRPRPDQPWGRLDTSTS